MTAQPWTDADVDRYALVIAAAGGDDKWINGEKAYPEFDPNQLFDDYRGDARAVLAALTEDGRLRAPVAENPAPSDAEIDDLAAVLTKARLAGVSVGHYTLARMILDAGYRRVGP